MIKIFKLILDKRLDIIQYIHQPIHLDAELEVARYNSIGIISPLEKI